MARDIASRCSKVKCEDHLAIQAPWHRAKHTFILQTHQWGHAMPVDFLLLESFKGYAEEGLKA